MAELEKIYRRNDNFVYRRIEGEMVLVPIRDNVGDLDCIYSLNPVGAMVWEHLDGSHDLDAIKNRIMAEYDVADDKAETDLVSFINEMKTIAAVDAVRR
ncbi:MAG TPA: PqqD family protein [Desulfobacterales bacterium]|nr:PqqD family protein [Desulfobacterales bacterium]